MQQIEQEAHFHAPANVAGRRPMLLHSKPRRRSRPRERSLFSLPLKIAAAVILVVAIAGAATPARLWATAALATRTGQLLSATGFGIDAVSVSGHRYTADSEIFDCLDLTNVTSLIALDSTRAAARIERLPWVASASITRVYPGRIDVAVTERTPFAVWITSQSARLIDITGRSLQGIPLANLPDLPRIAGDGAPDAARALFEMLAQVPLIGSRLKVATRITGRRWSLELSDGVKLELPPEGEAGALAALTADTTGQRLLAAHDTVIDLRSRREIAVRPAGAS